MNYYEILEVSINASKEVIKNAYRALIKKYHPDSYVGNKEFAQEKVKQINEAYETLIDDKKRLLYDYDNGFKIDPNAPKENEDNPLDEKDNVEINNEDNNSNKQGILKLLKDKKVIIIGIFLLFIFAFIVGSFIAENDNTKPENKDNENLPVSNEEIDKNTKNNNNDNTYIPKYNTNIETNSNNSIKYDDSVEEEKQENDNIEKDDEEQDEQIEEKEENIGIS